MDELDRRGHSVRVLSRTEPSGGSLAHRRVDLATGAGLVEALAGVEVVLDASNARGGKRRLTRVLVEGTGRLLAAEAEVGVRHHVLVSIVGIDEVPLGYYRAKLEQERLVEAAAQSASIMRSTQFHQLLDQIFAGCARFAVSPRLRLPVQPVDAREAAVATADAIESGPWPGRREIAGPQVRTLAELARAWTAATGRRLPMPSGRRWLDGHRRGCEARSAMCAGGSEGRAELRGLGRRSRIVRVMPAPTQASTAAAFEELRPYLLRVAYSHLGSLGRGGGTVVQEAWLRPGARAMG